MSEMGKPTSEQVLEALNSLGEPDVIIEEEVKIPKSWLDELKDKARKVGELEEENEQLKRELKAKTVAIEVYQKEQDKQVERYRELQRRFDIAEELNQQAFTANCYLTNRLRDYDRLERVPRVPKL